MAIAAFPLVRKGIVGFSLIKRASHIKKPKARRSLISFAPSQVVHIPSGESVSSTPIQNTAFSGNSHRLKNPDNILSILITIPKILCERGLFEDIQAIFFVNASV